MAAGKTAAAVLLLLDALVHRAAQAAPADRARVPVPVLLSLDGWNPGEDTAVDWAADRLTRQYTLFHGKGGRARARQLLEQGRISLFLDGLDEVTGKLRGAMVSALETAPFRLVLVSRAKEAVLTAKKARLGGAVAVEIQPVRPVDAAGYLLNRLPSTPSPAWQRLTGRLLTETGPLAAGPLAAALTGPLAIALLRDVYGDDDPVDELLDTARFPNRAAVENHLLDHAVVAAYTRRPGHPRPRYSARTAERTLRYLAARLTQEGARDLRWWHTSGWTDHRPRLIAVWIVSTVVCGPPGVVMAWSLHATPLVGVIGALSAIGGGYGVARRVAEFSEPQPLSSRRLARHLHPGHGPVRHPAVAFRGYRALRPAAAGPRPRPADLAAVPGDAAHRLLRAAGDRPRTQDPLRHPVPLHAARGGATTRCGRASPGPRWWTPGQWARWTCGGTT